ncbi:hypothetical protein BN871_DO_00200 [Paenibacillus sp. P22]|nr:hypothetical protein BN871_DO_00200 [Paenibacillus sp. P22]
MQLDAGINEAVGDIDEKHHEQQQSAVEHGRAHDDRIIAVVDAVHKILAHAGNGENLLDDEASRQDVGDQRPEQGDDRQHRVAQRMLRDDDERMQSFGAGRLDIVGGEHLHHVGPGHAGNDGDGTGSQRQPRQHRVAPGAPHGDRQQMPFHGHVFDQQRRHDEVRHGDAEHGEHHGRLVDQPVLVQGGDRSERDAGDDGEQDRDHAELEGNGETAADHRIYAVGKMPDRRTEIQLEQRLQIKHVLNADRLVQMVISHHVLHGRRIAVLAVLVERRPRHGMHEEKGHRDDQPQRHQHGDKPLQDVRCHLLSLPLIGLAKRLSSNWSLSPAQS